MTTKNFLYSVILIMLVGCSKDITREPVNYPKPLIIQNSSSSLTEDAELLSKSNDISRNRFEKIDINTNVNDSIFIDTDTKREIFPKLTDQQFANINVENLPIPVFINEIFGNILDISFQIDNKLQNLKDLVTLRLSEKQSLKQIFLISEKVLSNYGISILIKDKYIQFVPTNTISQSTPPLLVKGNSLPTVPVSHRPIFQHFTVKYGVSRQIISWVRQIYPNPDLVLFEDTNTNAIFISGTIETVSNAIEIIKFLDVSKLKNWRTIKIEPVFLPATVLAEKLTSVMQTSGYTANISFIFLPIEAVNIVIAFVVDEAVLENVKKWVSSIDVPNALADEQNLFFYQAKNTDIQRLYDVISPILSNSNKKNLKSGTEPPTSQSENFSQENAVIDLVQNSLIFNGDAKTWDKVLTILKKLDQPTRQVLIEVTIAEVTLSSQEEFGIEWLLNGMGIGDLAGTLATDALPVGSNGLTYLFNKAGQTRALLNAFARDNRITILSTPRIMVQSGEAASINVGDEVPIITSQTSSSQQTEGNTGILQQIQYRSTGISLSVKPIIYAENRVYLDISQSVSSANVNETSDISSPTISNRSIQTKLNLENGGSILLGGLISNNISETESGVPILKDIPFISPLFKTTSNNYTKQELIIMIIPYIIESDQEAKDITESFKSRLTFH